MKPYILALGAALTAAPQAMASVTFSTFVSGSAISSALGQDNTIGFTYAGDEFVGSVYFGSNNLQLYSTNLSGGNVQPFGSPIPDGGGEVVLAASLGQGGFPKGDIYTSGADSNIYHYANAGGSPSLFATLPGGAGAIRQVFFDPGSSFGGNMLVSTTSGGIYKVTSAGAVTLLASTGEDSEGMDIASTKYGQYAGDLLVSSEGSGKIRAITPSGTVIPLNLVTPGGTPTTIQEAETVSTVPLNLGSSGNPIEGFYVADYPQDVENAPASQFAGLLGDAIVTSEDSSDSPVWDLSYNGDTANTFTVTEIGNLSIQSEDGIFVTAQRITDVTVPEPATLAVLAGGLAALARVRRRR